MSYCSDYVQPSRRRSDQGGVALIEAMVAFVILAVSILAFTKIQVSLRMNGEVSKQRSEAVRLAQERLEGLRGFNVLSVNDLTTAQKTVTSEAAFNSLAAGTTNDAAISVGNTTYNRSVVVLNSATTPVYKSVVVVVTWVDRSGTAQTVSLRSLLAGIAPVFLAQTNNAAPGGGVGASPLRRNPKIPVTAVDLNNGKSGFLPPNSGTTYFVLDNLDASLFQQCTLSSSTATLTPAEYEANKGSCTSAPGYFLAGTISFDIKDNRVDNLVDSGGHRPADPPDSVCDYYLDASGKNLINGTAGTIAQAYSVITAQVKDLLYYAMAVTIGSPTPANSSTCQSASIPFSLPVGTDLATNGYTLNSIILSDATVTNTTDNTPVSGSWSTSVTNAGTGQGLLTFTPSGGLWAGSKNFAISISANKIKFVLKKNNADDREEYNSSAVNVSFGVGGVVPVLVSLAPANGSVVSDVNSNLTLSFDQNMAKGSGLIKLYRVKNGTDTLIETFNLPSATNVNVSGSVVTIDPVAALLAGETYYLTVDGTALVTSGSCSKAYAGFTGTSVMRFSTASAPSATTCPTNPLAFMGLTIDGLSTANPSGGSQQCYSDSLTVVKDSTKKYVNYFCVVLHTGAATSNFKWSGSLKVQGPTSWLSSGNYQVCRYTDPNGDNTVTNDEHPASYSDVMASLTDQNFLILKAGQTCPSQVLNVTQDISIYFKTVSHQP